KKIKSVSSVKKITNAMQLVSAVKMKKAQQIAIEGKPYQTIIQQAIKKLLSTSEIQESPYVKTNESASEKELTILITSNKGLCGSFNVNLLRFLMKEMTIKQNDFITLGKKGAVLINIMGGTILADYSDSQPTEAVDAVFDQASALFLEGKYKKIHVVYNSFVSSLRYDPTRETILPLIIDTTTEPVQNSNEDYLLEPKNEDLIKALLKDYILEKIRFSVLESEACEHSARMIAMKNATDNATDVIYNLTLLRNKLRQQKITYELLDMITAKESVETN
ncbi:MAG: ATP synthase F1 subunit gamma, partial [Patescibacteria group bacterium]